MKATVTQKGATITRLVSGVELKLQTSGKHWTLSVQKKDEKSGK